MTVVGVQEDEEEEGRDIRSASHFVSMLVSVGLGVGVWAFRVRGSGWGFTVQVWSSRVRGRCDVSACLTLPSYAT